MTKNNTKDIFLNEEHAAELVKDGVVKIPFLDENEVSLLKQLYEEQHPGEPPCLYDGIHMTIWHSDLEYKLNIRDKIKSISKSAFDRNFTDYRAISQQFIVKLKGEKTTFPIHQDWSIVNESDYFSLNIWIPLQDVSAENGAMWIVKGSHKIDRKIRGAGVLFPNYHSQMEDLKPYMTSFDMKAGEALIFYHSTIHGSPYNKSGDPRIVIQVSVLPKEAPMEIYFQKDAESPLEIHHPEDDFNFYYEKIREDSFVIPPTPKAYQLIPHFKPKKHSMSEILKAIKTDQSLNEDVHIKSKVKVATSSVISTIWQKIKMKI